MKYDNLATTRNKMREHLNEKAREGWKEIV